ncbi:MAG: ATP-binding cassette domain-containing protein, partial [candidate division Zixibacteria bacterium]|nr:ATP-binding cassette domain-containing protein [candidate division Zixibacteria bacterium]
MKSGTETSAAPIVRFSNVDFSYQRETVLAGVNLDIAPRDFAWVVGPNGGGKTTLVKLILGLLRPERGSVQVFGTNPANARRRVGYMPQQARLDLSF